ncbi:hypothetical protein [Heyndrickxia shackletonii]|nr:hypothetical protein [Heyndrickxia shackletonii]
MNERHKIRPMEITFETEEELDKFIEWAETPKRSLNKINKGE